jgi:tetratricopeptide (TPR) repeat protein
MTSFEKRSALVGRCRTYQRPRVRRLGVIAALVMCGLIARPASAQPRDSAAAQALFDEAKALMALGRAAEACPKLEESQRLDPGSGTLLNLAKCYQDSGRLASAWTTYLEAAALARTSGNPQRETTAREIAAALRPRVPKIVIEVPKAAAMEGLEITRDGKPVGSAQWGLPIPADEGKHTIEATAPGHDFWQTVIEVRGEGKTVTVKVPALRSRAAGDESESAPGQEGAEKETGLGTQRILALVAGGVGVVGVGVGTVFGLKSMSNKDDAEQHCDGAVCRDQQGVDLRSDAISAGNISTIGFAVGLAGLAGGAVLWLTAGGESEKEQVAVGVGPGAVSIKGIW